MRKALVAALALVAFALPAAALAHPLGNFTVNRYSEIALSGERVYVRYALDLAEIPTYQEGRSVRAPGFAAAVARKLVLELDGRRVALTPLEHRVQPRPGAGGLDTLRFDGVFAAPAGASGRDLSFRDENFERRLGWQEVVVVPSGGAEVLSADVPSTSASNALRSYPPDLLSSPLDVVSARVRYEPGDGPGTPPPLTGAEAGEAPAGGFESLIARGDLGVGVVLASLLVAMFWGAAHALTPGHGKAIVAGYLVGSRGKPRHAVLLGLIVTATHTAGVFALGLVTLLLSRFVVPERLYPWLTLASGVLVAGVGAAVLAGRARRAHAHDRHHHPHDHDHDHDHDHGHGYGRGGLLGVGVAAGLLPCPSALVVLLSAIALHRVGFGLALIVAFSLGLAATITAIGLLAVLARRAFGRLSLDGRLVRTLPAASALLILAVGIGITVNALPEVL
jgi:ABC-type nickel/cobalt efflux system permease component RcnA